jgi:hypothetical protein
VTWAAIWGDTKREGVYTCEEWKQYATKVFNDADRNRDGYVDVDAQEFEAIRKADRMFRDADLAYFDDNRDGRLSRAEFVNKPNPFFARYDKKGTCRVTLDDISNVANAGDKPARSGKNIDSSLDERGSTAGGNARPATHVAAARPEGPARGLTGAHLSLWPRA